MFQKIGVILALLTLATQVYSQINVNPDPDGEPWIIGPGNSLGEPADTVIIDPDALLSLPNYVDNSQEIFFWDIFNQGSYNSCSQAAGVAYTFAYEINRI